MKKFISNIKNKYGLSTVFAILILIVGCTFFSTGFIRYYEGVQSYYFNAVYMRYTLVGFDSATEFHIYLPSVCMILLNIVALFSSLIRKKFKLPILSLLAFPVLDFIMLFWIHADCAFTVKLLRELDETPGTKLTLMGYVYLMVCVVWAIAVVWEYLKSKNSNEAPIPISSEEQPVVESSTEDNNSNEGKNNQN